MTSHTVQTDLNGNAIAIETGKVAKQADGAVVVRCGGTMVLSTVVAARSPMEGRDFLPLTVEYREKAYAGGKTPGGFFKREGRPDEKETLTCRLIDRPIRPLFPKGFRNEIQVINLVISADDENDPDILAMRGALGRGTRGPRGGRAGRESHLQAARCLKARAGDRGHRRCHPHGGVRRSRDQRGPDARGAGLRP